jgi:hypothetical protein
VDEHLAPWADDKATVEVTARQLHAFRRSSGVRLRTPSAVQPLRATARRGVSSSAPGSWER